MFSQRPPRRQRVLDTLTVRIGGWFEAHATGFGVVAIPIVVVALLVAIGVRAWFG